MTISIITATYNSVATLRDTFESVLAQTYKDIDYIVVDGCSKDNTLDIIREYEPRFDGRMRWISEPDKGIYDAMNKGIRMAKGDVVGILNSDDFYFDNTVLAEISKAFLQHDTDSVFANLVYVNANNTDTIERIWKGSPYKPGRFQYGWVPAHPTFYVKRQCYLRFGDYDLSYQVSADFELMLRFLAKNRIKSHYIDRYFVRMRSGGESNGSLRNILLGNKNVIRAFKENGIQPSKLYPFFRLVPKIGQRLKIQLMNIAQIKPKFNQQ